MHTSEQEERRPRADFQRNRAALLQTAQRHFRRHGVGTSLEAIARDAGVGAGTLYRHFPTREGLLAAVLQTRSAELAARQAECERVDDSVEALDHWLLAMEEYLSAFSGLPDPLMAAAQAQDPSNPLTIPCTALIATTEKFVSAAQRAGRARASIQGGDLYLAACSVAWIRGNGAEQESLERLRSLITMGYREQGQRA
ncbi:TetR/AcrR family transcriptional regulator [Nocardiopsis tropica]|uniref:Helix-turn-helix domain-containing protein n=1 Tax=Nocardiopsis tropica TaxID=109330 RepID=A0ABV2A5V1_9ACTN